MIKFFKKLFNLENDEINRVLLVPGVWAYGFKSRDGINFPYFYSKFKVLKEGNLKEMGIYFDRMDRINSLTYKKWIMILKEK